MRLNKAVYRYIEHELYCYEDSRKELESLRNDIIEASPLPSVRVSGGHVKDFTAVKGIRLLSNASIARLERVIWAIDKSLAILSEDHRNLFLMKYKQGLPWQRVCMDLPCAERTYYNLNNGLIMQVASFLGFDSQK